MTLSRSPIKPGTPVCEAPGCERKATRDGRCWGHRPSPGPARHALMRRSDKPLRQRSAKPSAKHKKAEQEGPQWRLCHVTECVACFHARWVRQWGRDVPVLWSYLGPGTGCHGHHEPPKSLGGRDQACVSLCPPHHEQRHRMGFHAFWLCIDVEGALQEMRRRVSINTTASETP